MPDGIPACFRAGAVGGPPTSTAAGPSLTTSVYETRLGYVALTWSRTVLGLSLSAYLRLFPREDGDEEDDDEPLRFRVRPWLLWKRRGSKRFHPKQQRRHRAVELAWDLARASFPHCGGPEPTAGYYVVISVDCEVLLIAGDLADEAYKKTKSQRPNSPFSKPVLISRREHVVLGDAGGRRSYRTQARLGGREREISIDIGAKEKERELGMSVNVEGERVLQVRRLRWKFRGSEKVEVEGGGWIQVSWDLHNWLFQAKDDAAAHGTAASTPPPEVGHAVFVFRFEREEGKDGEGRPAKGIAGNNDGYFGKGLLYRGLIGGGYSGKNLRNWSESSSGGGEVRRRGRRNRSLRKTSSSSSSTSSASSASSSTVMEWTSKEEVELQRAEGFSLLVYAWKN